MRDPGQRPSRRPWLAVGLIAGLAQLGLALPAQASEGYFQNGIGARHKALAGAGVAAPVIRCEDIAGAWRAACDTAAEDDKIIVFGSFLTVAAVMRERQRRA